MGSKEGTYEDFCKVGLWDTMGQGYYLKFFGFVFAYYSNLFDVLEVSQGEWIDSDAFATDC